MNQLLMQNYLQCCRERLRLWVSEAVSVELMRDDRLMIEFEERSLSLVFHPEGCQWKLFAGGESSVGNFSRLTKKCRQYLTQT